MISLLLTLTGCSTYKSKFNCGDAEGAYCASMDHVDQMINSGEIERFNETRQAKRYKALKGNNALTPSLKPRSVQITNYKVEDNAGD
jgi:hypothetical protein